MNMAQKTADELKLQLQRIDEKMADSSSEAARSPDLSIDLRDEKAVTKRCLPICQDAKDFIESLMRQESSVLSQTVPSATIHAMQ